MNADEQYNKVCKQRFEDIHRDVKETKERTKEIHQYLFKNGLMNKVTRNTVFIGIISGVLACIGTAFVWQALAKWL